MNQKIKTFRDYEVKLNSVDDDFLKIAETLTRVGIHLKEYGNTLVQVCYILHKKGKYYIILESEVHQMDMGRSEHEIEVDEETNNIRRKIVELLEEWGMCKLVKPEEEEIPTSGMYGLTVIPFKEKENWSLMSLCDIAKWSKTAKIN